MKLKKKKPLLNNTFLEVTLLCLCYYVFNNAIVSFLIKEIQIIAHQVKEEKKKKT